MRFLRFLLPLFLSGLLILLVCMSASAQIYGNSNQRTVNERRETPREQNSSEPDSRLQSVPGLNYDPNVELVPITSDMQGASSSGTISFEEEDTENDYNIQRAWRKGAAPDQIVKVGDIESNQTLSELIDIETLTLREIAANGGAAVERVPLKDIGLIRNMTMGEFLEAFPIYQDASIKDFPILLKTVYEGSQNPQEAERIAITRGEQLILDELTQIDPSLSNIPLSEIATGNWEAAAVEGEKVALRELSQELAKVDPALSQVPLGEIVRGDWDGALAQGGRVAAEELVKAHPELAGVPIGEVTNGNWEQAAISVGEQQALEELAKIDPALGQIPLGEIANGDWDGAIAEGKKIAVRQTMSELTKVDPALSQIPLAELANGDWDGAIAQGKKVAVAELVEKYPELQNVPVAEILDGNWDGAKDKAITLGQEWLVKELSSDPMFEGIPVAELVRGDWEGALSKAAQEQLVNLMEQYPELRGLPADKLFPIIDGAIRGDWESVKQQATQYAMEKGLEIGTRELLKAVPELANTPLGALPIEDLTVGDIQGLADKPLETMPKIANRYIAELGMASQTPGTMLVVDSAMILLTGDVYGRLDIPFAGPIETPVTNVLTGGTRNQVFLPEPCTEQSCKHFELTDVLSGIGGLGNIQGKAWVEGKSQDVPGGKGFLQAVNGGEEPTGVPVWSTDAHVKLSLEDIKEGGGGEAASATVWANFQVCVYPPFMGEHCTPHFISVPTPWKVTEGSFILVFSRASLPDFVQQAREQVENQHGGEYVDSFCNTYSASFYNDRQDVQNTLESMTDAPGENLKTYLARIAAGESGGGRNIGPNPSTGAYGEYQFTPSSRQLLMSRYPELDPWSTDKAVRDRSAVKWIELYGQERGIDIVDTIEKGDFETADHVLGQHVYNENGKIVKWGQFTSLPGGAEEHVMWKNPEHLAKYSAAGKARNTNQAFRRLCPKDEIVPGQVAQAVSNTDGTARERVYTAMESLGNFSTASMPGTNGGRVACMGAVNRVIQSAGYKPLDGLSVLEAERVLKSGRGTALSPSQTGPGDIVIVADNEVPGGRQHVGICLNAGCTRVKSNSSTNASFSWISNGTFSPSYRGNRVSHYRLRN